MKKNFILICILLIGSTFGSSCSEIEDGVNRMDEWEDDKIEVDYPAKFVHPGIMHTTGDIERSNRPMAATRFLWRMPVQNRIM